MAEARVETLYLELKRLAVGFDLKPGQRVNEGALAQRLAVSRTPLREALNRLVGERLLDFRPGLGFFCRPLEPQEIFDLYETRAILEEAAIRRACLRASASDIAALKAREHPPCLVDAGKSTREATASDEAFHLAIARLSGNDELVLQLARLNERIRFIRWLDVAKYLTQTRTEHGLMIEALEARDAEEAARLIREHIGKRMDQIVASVREGYSNLYVTEPPDPRAHSYPSAD